MKINIYDLYISFCKNDIKIFEKIIKKVIEYHNGNPIIIIHFIFNKDDKIYNIKTLKEDIPCEIILIQDNQYSRTHLYIRDLTDIVTIFLQLQSEKGKNVFIYSGHSDGLILGYKHIYFISMDDFSEIILGVLGKKCDLVWGDACLMGNISSLHSLKNATKYLIASPMYYNYDSVLELKNLYRYREDDSMFDYSKRMIDEYMRNQRKKFIYKYFMVNIVLYEMNLYVSKLVNIIMKHKDRFEYDLCSMSKRDYYYLDILCALKQIDSKDKKKVKNYLDKIILYKKQYDIGNNLDSKLLIILREPYSHLEYDNPLFFK